LLRITVQNFPPTVTLKLEGQLKGPWVHETEKAWRDSKVRVAVVDLRDVTSIDAQGRKLLAAMHRQGVELVADAPMMKYVIEEATGKHNH